MLGLALALLPEADKIHEQSNQDMYRTIFVLYINWKSDTNINESMLLQTDRYCHGRGDTPRDNKRQRKSRATSMIHRTGFRVLSKIAV